MHLVVLGAPDDQDAALRYVGDWVLMHLMVLGAP